MIRAAGGNGPIPHNPWLTHPQHRQSGPMPCATAGIVEYLRWLRTLRGNPENDSQVGLVNNGEVLELLDIFERTHEYADILNRLTQRTRRLATVSFEVRASWRIRVGGMRGPESMLLPAFDALGMPYIPSTTLKGAARAVAMQFAQDKNNDLTLADVKRIFGDLDPDPCMGQVIFLDAYPLPFDEYETGDDEAEGLVPDMANSIWTWSEQGTPTYKSNPNTFLSLRKTKFVIGLRVGSGGEEALEQVQQWLLQGLAQGIGSRINSGYGRLEPTTQNPKRVKSEKVQISQMPEILLVGFELQGQLGHGRQNFNQWQLKRNHPEWKPPGKAQAEVRPPAFRSMLRYWFRTLALGVIAPTQVKALELKVFGGIEPNAMTGLFQLEIPDGHIKRDNPNNRNGKCGSAEGTLILRSSSTAIALDNNTQKALRKLLASLTWLMFHLGGVGLGARRPCYSRQDRQYAPWWRGSTLNHISDEKLWKIRKAAREWTHLEAFQNSFQTRLKWFYEALAICANSEIDFSNPLEAPLSGRWAEAIDQNCRIICVQGDSEGDEPNEKPPALALLHKMARRGDSYDRQLCGSMNERSPIWIARNRKRYDVVTIFGIENRRRQEYLNQLESLESPIRECRKIWPFT